MNYDGKAFVMNSSARLFASVNNQAIVIEDINTLKHPYLDTQTKINMSHTTNTNTMKATSLLYLHGLVPYSSSVSGIEKQQKFNEIRFTNIKDSRIHDKQEDFYYNIARRTFVSRIQPTNIKYNPKTVIVSDSEPKESEFLLNGVCVNVYSKTVLVVPKQSGNYSDMSLVTQKNSFIEIKIPENVTDIIDLPESLTYLPGYIKGTFTKSGEYNIKIKYRDGEQILNIIVPYYQRLL